MTPELEALGRRVRASKHWRWMPGMVASVVFDMDGDRWPTALRLVDQDFVDEVGKPVSGLPWRVGLRAYPDLSDPATLGCLMALVREAWGCFVSVVATMQRIGRQYKAFTPDGVFMFDWYSTEAEALVAALEAAT
jgi:hypothetical protein